MIELKEHNKRPYEELCRMLEEHDKCAYVSATGTGKSYVVGKYIEEHDLIDKTLMLVPSNAIKKSWQKLLPGMEIKSYQWLAKDERSLEKYELIACDEIHHLGAEKWGDAFNKGISACKGKVIGMTATPVRFLDQCRDMTQEVFEGHVVEGLNLPQAISAGILPNFEYTTALYDMPQRARKYKCSNRITPKLRTQLDFTINRFSFKSILRTAINIPNCKTAVFVNRITDLDKIEGMVREIFPEALHIVAHSKMSEAKIKKALRDFSTSETSAFIYTVNLLNEGVHIEGVNAVVMFRRTESPIIYLQQIGRALCSDSSKKHVSIVDFVANHANLENYTVGQSTTVSWISNAITNPQRQIIVNDYALEELELLEKMRRLYDGAWTEEEDSILRQHYKRGNIGTVMTLLPERTKDSICARAKILGLAIDIRNNYTEEFYEDLKTLYMGPDGTNRMLKKYPFVSRGTLTKIANSRGFYKLKQYSWTDEEIEILKNNISLSQQELLKLLPGQSVSSISTERRKLGYKKTEYKWDTKKEEEFSALFEEGGCRGVQDSGLFNELTVNMIYNKAKKLKLIAPKGGKWEQDKIDYFTRLYQFGGRKAVLADPKFSNMSVDKIKWRVEQYGITNTYVRWSSKENCIFEELLNKPISDDELVDELTKKLPGKSLDSIKAHVFIRRREAANA